MYVGLRRVKDIERDTVAQILSARPFASFDDFLNRVSLSAAEVENLIKIGAFDSIDSDRHHLLWRLRLGRHRPAARRESGDDPPGSRQPRDGADIFSGRLMIPRAKQLPSLPSVTPFENSGMSATCSDFPPPRIP